VLWSAPCGLPPDRPRAYDRRMASRKKTAQARWVVPLKRKKAADTRPAAKF